MISRAGSSTLRTAPVYLVHVATSRFTVSRPVRVRR